MLECGTIDAQIEPGDGYMANQFTFSSYIVRLIFAVLLVYATYNPSGYSYFHWLTAADSEFSAVKALCGITLIIGWAVYLRATFNALGTLGLILGLAFFGAIVWLLFDLGLLSMESSGILSYVVLFMLAAILSAGMSWSHLRRRWSGQQVVDEVND
jgi:hypothetical protein